MNWGEGLFKSLGVVASLKQPLSVCLCVSVCVPVCYSPTCMAATG